MMTKQLFIGVRGLYAMLLAFTGALIAASAGAAPTNLASGTLDSGFGKAGRVITTVGMPASGAPRRADPAGRQDRRRGRQSANASCGEPLFQA